MTDHEAKARWSGNYRDVDDALRRMTDVERVVCAFNTNVDAVIKLPGRRIAELVKAAGIDEHELRSEGARAIRSPADLVRGLVRCFMRGIAEEWLIDDERVFHWARDHVGHDRLQMGGQAGIVANVLAACGVRDVLVHCASLPALQSGRFLDLPNLRAVGPAGGLGKARDVARDDPPMIHWILEFDGGDTLPLPGGPVTCPKSNRFIATYDPLNLRLQVDPAFSRHVAGLPWDVAILSGYHLLTARLPDGSSGTARVDASMEAVRSWRAANPDGLVHLEVASTQDLEVRRRVLDGPARQVDSLGVNDREAIDLLEVLGERDLVDLCHGDPHADTLFRGLLRLFLHTGCPRIQLHLYGLYITVQRKGFRIAPVATRRGMQAAAVVAAGKAGTGAADDPAALRWALGREVSDTGLAELRRLAGVLATLPGDGDIEATGVREGPDFDVVAVPTILVERPVTLVGLGDTISSVSLVGSL